MASDKGLGERHRFDHAFVGFASLAAIGDDAVLAQDQSVARLVSFECRDGFFGEPEARHDVRHEAKPAVENIGAFLLAVGLVDDAQHRGRVRVVDEFVRQKRVQHHLDRRVRRGRIDQVGAFDGDQFDVANMIECAQAAHRLKPHRAKAGRIGGSHVGARGLDVQHFDVFAETVATARFQRRVAAAVQDEFGIAAEQPRRVNAQRQIPVDPGWAGACNKRLGVGVDPAALHVALSRPRNGATTSRCGAVDCRCRLHRPR